MTDTQRAAMEQALAFIQDIDRDDNDRDILSPSRCKALDASRNALRVALADPVVEPVATQWLAEMIMSDCGCSTNNQRLVDRIVARIEQYDRANTSPPPTAEVPLLTDDQCRSDFEAFVNAELGDVAVTDQERYISPKIQNYWRVWQTAIQKAGIK